MDVGNTGKVKATDLKRYLMNVGEKLTSTEGLFLLLLLLLNLNDFFLIMNVGEKLTSTEGLYMFLFFIVYFY